MKKKVMKGLPKRIAAFVMAVLMFMSLMPIDPSVVLAEDPAATVTFNVGKSNAIVNVYRDDVLIATGTTDESGNISTDVQEGDGALIFVDEINYNTINPDDTYEVIAYGYNVETGIIGQEQSYPISVSLETSIYKIAGTIELPGENTNYNILNAVELLFEDGTSVMANGNPVKADIDESNGTFAFEGVTLGFKYQVKITSEDNSYAIETSEVNLTDVENIEEVTNIGAIELSANTKLDFGFSEEPYRVSIAGTPLVISPSFGVNNVNDYTIKYEFTPVPNVSIEKDDETQNITVTAVEGATVGDISVEATLTGETYVTVSSTFVIQIYKAEKDGFSFIAEGVGNGESSQLVYGNGTLDLQAGVDGVADNSVIYKVDDGDANPSNDPISVDENGIVTINKVGSATVEAILQESGINAETKIRHTVNVIPADQTNEVTFVVNWSPTEGKLTFPFGKDDSENTYNFAATTGEQEESITYKVTDAEGNPVLESVATIDTTGQFICKKPGTYIVIATSEKENYNDKTASYTVEITKADPGIHFTGTIAPVINGKYLLDGYSEFAEAELVSDADADLNTGVTYSTDSGLIEVEEFTGEITFVNIKDASADDVEITITATRAEDATYAEGIASYTFKVVNWNPEEEGFSWDDIYELTGATHNGWFTNVNDGNPITVSIKDGKTYAIFAEAPTNDTVASPSTSFEVTDLDDGDNNKISFYIMDTSDVKGYISGKHTVNGIKVDEITPSVSIKHEKVTFIGTIIDKLLSFFNGEEVQKEFTVEVSETPGTSEVTKYYYIPETDTTVPMSEGEYTALTESDWIKITDETVIKLPENSQKVIYAKVVDEAGHVSYAHTNGLITDNQAPTITLTPSEIPESQMGYYTEDFTVSVKVDDQENLSGIKEIVYWIGEKTDEGTVLETFAVGNDTTVNDLKYSYERLEYFEFAVEDYPDGVTVYVQAVDNAGNASEVKEATYKVYTGIPEIELTYDNNDVNNTNYYKADRTATIKINCREDIFDLATVTVNVDNQTYNVEWDENKSATVVFNTNGEHNIHVIYNDPFISVPIIKTATFWIDKDIPIGTATLVEVEGSAWDTLLETLTFGIWKKPTVNVKATATDATTSVTMQYFVSNTDRILTTDELSDSSVVWVDYTNDTNISLSNENIYAVYFKLTDLAGNVKYISTDGFVIDGTFDANGITLTPEAANGHGFYHDDVKVNVTVSDLKDINGINVASGIKSIRYEVKCGIGEDAELTQSGELYSYTYSEETPVVGTVTDKEILVDVEENKNNNENVVVTVYVEDNAGNTASNSCTLKVNATAPKFSISYDNNEAEGNDEKGYFFAAGRTATITLVDEVYDNTAINSAISVVLTDKAGNEVVDNGVVFSGWTQVAENTYETTVTFTKDGYYTVDVDYTNLAGVPNKEVTAVEGTVGALEFAIDTVAPEDVTISALGETWEAFLEAITFGLYTNEDVTFEISANDATSDVTIEYLIYEEGKTTEELDRITSWNLYNPETKLTVSEEQRMSVYVKVTDQAGNVAAYINSEGIVLDKTPATITLPDFGDTIHKGDVEVNVGVTDAGVTSGIKSVKYTVGYGEGESYTQTQEGTLALAGGTILVDSSLNNRSDVVVTVTVEDYAGNETVEKCELSINTTVPTVGISYDENNPKVADGKYFYGVNRTATITITDRADTFDATAATNAIKVVLKDKAGKVVEDKGLVISAWTTDGDTHTATVKFTKDGYYTVGVEYTNKAGLSNKDAEGKFVVTPANTTIAPFDFVIDTTAPSNVSVSALGKAWDEFLETITFGFYSKDDVVFTIVAEDATSNVQIEYYVSKDGANKKVADLTDVIWDLYTLGDRIIVDEEQQMSVYVKVTDRAGNITYVNSNGVVLDKTQAGIVLTPEAAITGNLYNSDVDVAITVDDAAITSGIKTVTYWITCDGTETKRENVYTFDIANPTKAELKQTFEKVITVNAAENTGSNVVVTVEVVDNAGNTATKSSTPLSINTIAPQVDISYNNNESTGHDGGVNYFFNKVRTATITITDRADSFDATAATNAIKVVLKDKAGNTVADKGITISEWASVGDKHTATVAFTKDGYYTIAVEYTNKAELKNVDSEGNYVVTPSQDTVGALAFAIDTTAPVDVKVSALTKTWDALLTAITFGLYTAEDVVFTIAGDDVMSNVIYEYYIANDGQAMTAQQLAQVADELWTEYTAPVTISTEQQMAIFVRVTDQAGNITYVNSNGIVIDKKQAGITLTPEAANTNGVYNSDVDVTIAVDDSDITSGIKSVEYWITKDGEETKRETLYTFDKTEPTKAELKQTYNGTITVDAMTNNSSNVEVFVKVIDRAGNVNQKSVVLDIDMIAPTVEVSYDDVTPVDIVNGKGFFKTSRTATIVVTERTNHFDKEAFASAVAITAKNSANASLSAAVPVVEYVSTTEGATADAATHTFKVVFSADANYTLAINYTDKAGWTCADAQVEYDENAVAPQNFAIDTKAPTGKITVGNLGFWESLLTSFTFGLWSPSDVNIVITGADATSPIKSIEYYKTSTFTPMTVEQLEAVTAWVAKDKFTVSSDDIFVVYAKITDQTGHVSYISSNGIIVDETKPVFETYKPEVTITPQRPVNGIYDGNVKVDIGVIDPVVGNNSAYAGLRSVVYEVSNMGTKTQEGTLYNFTETNPTKDKLLQKWNGNIVVDASKNNSNNVVVKVTATDNAGNQTVATTTLKIDTTKPVIEVSYDNNNGDTSFGDSVYYNANRVATIRVTERNFDPSAVNVVITNTDGTVPTISGWTTTAGTGNGDNTVHTATIVYAADGDYTFAISAKDKVGNANSGVNYGASQAPTAFTIDKTVPVISIAYDNNDFANENYYKADRTATITILEHNFDASRVVATITATDNGQPVNAPAISNWSKSGDTYTATVNYNTDALYTFDISYSDKAQNEAADFAQQSFYVDKTMPQMSITEIVDQSANNKDKIGFVITATDTNFDVFTPVLTAVVKTETGFATKELNIASINDIANGRVYTISNIDTDGIYRITCTLVDKAGNAYNSVTLHQADGTPYVTERTAADTLVSFSVNRDGSVFEVDEATKEVLDNYYVYDVKEDIVIIEVNANQLTSNTVSLNGKELVEGTDYTIATEGGNGAWLRYSYSLNKELFAEEGEYTIVVSSTDEAENNAFSDVKDMKVAFVVDRTAPVVTVSGLETNGKYQTDAQTVTLIPTDDGGAVKSIVVNQVDADGNVIKPLLAELSGEALETALEENDGQISFVIPSGSYDYIEIVCADCSVNEAGSTNTVEILIEDVLITENELALIWATYQYVIIGGGAAAVAAPTGIVLFRRRLKLKVK